MTSHTSVLGVFENIQNSYPGPLCGTPTATFFNLAVWGPVVVMTSAAILSGTPPPGMMPFICTYAGGTYLYMRGTPTMLGVYTFTVRAQLSNGGHEDTACVQTVQVSGLQTLTAVDPPRGTKHGGTVVTLTGQGFTGVTSVTFGGAAATSVHVINDISMTCITPAHAVGPVDVIAVGDATLTAGYTYVSVDLVTPTRGTVAGGTSVTVTGYGFAGATQVTFGGTSATGVVVTSNTSLMAVTPAHASGVVDVTVVGVDTGLALYAYTLGGVPQTLGKSSSLTLPPMPTRAPFKGTS